MVLFAVLARLPFMENPPFPDEGGYLLVAQHWTSKGPMLYGPLFVDRPPLLILFWRLASLLGGVEAARSLACVVVALLVAAAAWAGMQLGHSRGAFGAAVVAAALSSTPLLGGQEVDGELLAAPLVMLSCATALMVVRRRSKDRARVRWALLSGVAGASALLVKQNFFDGLAFAAALIVLTYLHRGLPGRVTLRILGAGILGACLPLAVIVIWAGWTPVGVAGLWFAMYGFRSAAGQVIASHSVSAPEARLKGLLVAGALSGLLVIIGVHLGRTRRRLASGDAVIQAMLVMLVVGLAGVALGGSYWTHYLVGLVPVAALMAATLMSGVDRHAVARGAVALVAVSSLATTTVVAAAAPDIRPGTDVLVSRLLRAAAHPSDTVVVAYGQANIIQESGLRPAYPYLWSLPMRTLDPHLTRLIEVSVRPACRDLGGGRSPRRLVGHRR